MHTEKPALPDQVIALFEGVDRGALVKFAGDYAVQAAIREMLAARTVREQALAFAMAQLASNGSLPTSNFAPGTHVVVELSAPKRPGLTRTITTNVIDMGLHRIESDACSDGFEPVPSAEVGDAVHICSKDFDPAGRLGPLTQVTAGLGVWLVRQGTKRALAAQAEPSGEQSRIPLVLERLVADDVQIIPPVGNAPEVACNQDES